jgi:uncharacterized protein (TIGR04141 family)
MPALNFFRLYPRQKDRLLEFLAKKGLSHIETKALKNLGRSFEISLYFSSVPKKSFVKWIGQLQEVFDIPDKKIDNYSAVMLISSRDLLYALSYGMAHFYLAPFADLDFGIDIASRLLSTYSIKNSRSFGGKTTKTILTYDNITELVFDGGESVSYVKGRPTNPERWGKTISCGQSVQLRRRDFSPATAHKLAVLLDRALRAPKKTEIPRSTRVTDKPTTVRLTNNLIADMRGGNYMFAISAQQLSGVEFIFSDMFSYHLPLKGEEIELDHSLSLEVADQIVKEHFSSDYGKFLLSDVEAREDGRFAFKRKLISFIDYVDSRDNKYYLDEGQWYEFDTNYLANLRNAVDLIPLELKPEIHTFDEKEYQQWLGGKEDHEKFYRERFLNDKLSAEFSYENFDRSIFRYDRMSIEYADLVRGDELTFVKIGVAQKLNYVIDQSINALRTLQHSGFYLDVGGTKRRVGKITLWLFFKRKGNVTSLADLHSLIFLMKLANWRREVLLAGLSPLVKISYSRGGT